MKDKYRVALTVEESKSRRVEEREPATRGFAPGNSSLRFWRKPQRWECFKKVSSAGGVPGDGGVRTECN